MRKFTKLKIKKIGFLNDPEEKEKDNNIFIKFILGSKDKLKNK